MNNLRRLAGCRRELALSLLACWPRLPVTRAGETITSLLDQVDATDDGTA